MPESSTVEPAPDIVRKAVAESVGTFVLVFFGVGSAVFGSNKIGDTGVALAFGLVLLALAYSIGPLTGCHVNPAVTLGILLRKGITTAEAGYYWVAQLVGAVVAAALIKLMVSGFGGVTDQTGALGTNNWGPTISMGGTFVLEVVLTFLLVFVVLLVTHRQAAPGFAGLAIGLTLAVIHLVGIPLDGTSVNPARSIGPALLNGGEPLAHVWLFILAPLVGGVIAALAAPYFETAISHPEVDPTGADVPG
ncbi:aquaporin [Intrasporangium flavum]|uniref:aquaporin n=1 Tax=Intrasporangium flavum TaxID=1428657 RepID=UPI00096E9AA0|nr:aquaporin [Intrasporangium flavum]